MASKRTGKRSFRVWLLFMCQVGLVVALFVFGLYMGVYLHDKSLIEQQVLTSARAHFENILITRMWNASHGGVYVEKRPGVELNPYLDDGSVKTDDGRTLYKRNPATMTRELSELADAHGIYRYSITSIKPLNPDNQPDEFERFALEEFERGSTEIYLEEQHGDATYFRYMSSLKTTEQCLQCHAKQGYKVGDVRGGISVTFDISPIKRALKTNQTVILVLIVVSAVLIIGIFCLFTLRLMKQLHSAHAEIEKLAITDELTGIANRRYFMQRFEEEVDRARRYGSSLAMVMIDIDHFKDVNDTHGHPVGDMVLQEVTRLLAANIRTSDLIARYGGEEFAILIPAMTVKDAAQAAEKLRLIIEVNDLALEGPSVKVTVSAGVADFDSIRNEEGNLRDKLLRHADKALYVAKANGRNRVERYNECGEKQLTLI